MSRTLIPLLLLVLTGCARQDTEILGRVGRNLAGKAKASTAGLRERLPFRIAAGEPSVAERVQQRLASDRALAGVAFDVQANGSNGGDVEVKGTVERDEQKRRAVELAETTVGVERVIDSIERKQVANSPTASN
jgi:osmotically-inducible protein OsmY